VGERVNTYPTEKAAQQDIERCKREDRHARNGELLVDTAIKAHMQMFGVIVKRRGMGLQRSRGF